MPHCRRPPIPWWPRPPATLPRGDLVARLSAALHAHAADLAVARTFEQPHPVFCLCRRESLPHLTAYLQSGERKFERWVRHPETVEVAFDYVAGAFENINTRCTNCSVSTLPAEQPSKDAQSPPWYAFGGSRDESRTRGKPVLRRTKLSLTARAGTPQNP